MLRGATKIRQAEPLRQCPGRHRLAVLRPQPQQTLLRIVSRRELRFAAVVKPDQHPFEIRGEVSKLQVLAAFDCLRVTPGGAVLCQPIGVEKYQSALVASPGICVPPPAIDGEFDDGTGIPATGDDDIEMEMKTLFVA